MDLLRAKLTRNVTKNQDLFQVNWQPNLQRLWTAISASITKPYLLKWGNAEISKTGSHTRI